MIARMYSQLTATKAPRCPYHVCICAQTKRRASSGISRRTLSAWQSARVIGFRRVGRTILFSITDIQTAIDRYRIAPIGEPRPRRQSVETGTITTAGLVTGGESLTRKHRMQRIAPEPVTS